MGIHGGDVYRNHVDLDFSINVNPLGAPEAVKTALHDAVGLCGQYPDMEAERLKSAVSEMLAVPEEMLLFGNGTSELLMAVAHAIQPRKTVIPVPSFYGYEYAAGAAGGEIVYYETRQEDFFGITEGIYEVLTEDVDLLFLANPNNPTGMLLQREKLRALLRHCRDRGIYVVLDECFVMFCGNPFSMLSEISSGMYDNLVLVRAFTKMFAIPGVRLGYLVCGSRILREKIRRQLPEWNLSCFAQEAGCICAKQAGFVEETRRYVGRERQFLADGLRRKGYVVFPSMANFMLIYHRELLDEKLDGEQGVLSGKKSGGEQGVLSDRNVLHKGALYECLLRKGILIRDCSNFRGLGIGFYRIAVRTRQENEQFLRSCPCAGVSEFRK